MGGMESFRSNVPLYQHDTSVLCWLTVSSQSASRAPVFVVLRHVVMTHVVVLMAVVMVIHIMMVHLVGGHIHHF